MHQNTETYFRTLKVISFYFSYREHLIIQLYTQAEVRNEAAPQFHFRVNYLHTGDSLKLHYTPCGKCWRKSGYTSKVMKCLKMCEKQTHGSARRGIIKSARLQSANVGLRKPITSNGKAEHSTKRSAAFMSPFTDNAISV